MGNIPKPHHVQKTSYCALDRNSYHLKNYRLVVSKHRIQMLFVFWELKPLARLIWLITNLITIYVWIFKYGYVVIYEYTKIYHISYIYIFIYLNISPWLVHPDLMAFAIQAVPTADFLVVTGGYWRGAILSLRVMGHPVETRETCRFHQPKSCYG
jgi:hypothetical protein